MRHAIILTLILSVATLCQAQQATNGRAAEKNQKPDTIAPGGLVPPQARLKSPEVERDFPAVCVTRDGTTWVAYVEFDGTADTLRLAKRVEDELVPCCTISGPGSISLPGLAIDADGMLRCVWGQLVDGQWDLLCCTLSDGQVQDEVVTLVDSPGNDVFPDVQADRQGRIWVTWQSLAGGSADVFVKYLDPTQGSWSEPIQVTDHPTGDWEPRLAAGADNGALIVFDSYRNGNFDVFVADVSLDGDVKITPVATTDRYEARAEAAVSPDGKTLWVAYDEGMERWGKDLGSEWRKTGGGLGYDRHLFLTRVDLSSGKATSIGDITPLIPGLMPILGKSGSSSINLPEVAVDAQGNPWIFYRYLIDGAMGYWKAAVTKYDVAADEWAVPKTFGFSSYCLDRRLGVAMGPDGQMAVAWPADLRKTKQHLNAGVFTATIDTAADWPTMPLPEATATYAQPMPEPINNTPERSLDDRHTWQFGGEEYTLYWGDFHRHTDISNCRTEDDGCIVEHYRYAYEATGLDYLATTDHTEVGKVYHPYEWWLTQNLVDMFHNPGRFLAFYAYEREQKWPYGHRNVVFLERGGPVVYIQRKNYEKSPWVTPLPPQDGVREGEIPPWQLWDILKASGHRVATIEHTAAGGMGTDWSVYEKIDSELENLVEIYQGSRESYEAVGAPQPAVATTAGPQDFGKHAAGTYQNALRLGHKLGAFASSDHRSTNITFGGLYVKKFDREGIFDAIDARLSIAATDKIYMDFSCNGHMLGSVFETVEKPTLSVAIHGTAPLAAVTLIRNEENIRRFTSESADLVVEFTDPVPVDGENRYYLRVEQTDGNMGWTSPIWVTYKP